MLVMQIKIDEQLTFVDAHGVVSPVQIARKGRGIEIRDCNGPVTDPMFKDYITELRLSDGSEIALMIQGIGQSKVRLGLEAPKNVRIIRESAKDREPSIPR
jgi:hypothetical protein